MPTKINWNDKNLIESVVKESHTWVECLKKLNLVNKTQTRERLKRYIDLHKIEATHIGTSIWSNEIRIKEAVALSKCFSHALKYLGLNINSGNFDTLNKYILKYKIDTKHFDSKEVMKNCLETARKNSTLSVEEILRVNSLYSRSSVKRILERFNLLEYKCAFGHEAIWEGKKLVLHIDHINGIPNDNRIENLRYLCPNCHSQTHTYSGKNIKNNREVKEVVKKEKVIREHKTKIDWPNNEELQKLLNTYPMSKLAKQLNVSDRAIRKRAQTRNLIVPTDIYGQGYWAKDRVSKK